MKQVARRGLVAAAVGLVTLLPIATPGYAGTESATAGADPAAQSIAVGDVGETPSPLSAGQPAPGEEAAEATPMAGCSGSSCNGKDPSAQGCSATNAGGSRYFNVQGDRAYMSISVRDSSNCNARWARVIIDNWLGQYGPPFKNKLRIRIQRQVGEGLCGAGREAAVTDGDATPDCETWWTTHSYTKTLDCCSATGNYWTAMVQDTASGNERHRECYRFRYWQPTTSGGYYYWTSYNCGPWRY